VGFEQTLVLAALGLVPVALLSLTAFVKIGTVLQLVRSALGVQGVPSGAVMLVLSAALTALAMAPVGGRIAERLQPVLPQVQHLTLERLVQLAPAVTEPWQDFLFEHSAPEERVRFLRLAERRAPNVALTERSLLVLVPAFLVSELLAAFALGFALYLPFLVVDWVVANVLVGLGLAGLSPGQVATPLKLLLFVALRGWGLLAETLLAGYSP
jgi:type III secretion protein R